MKPSEAESTEKLLQYTSMVDVVDRLIFAAS